MVAVALVAYAVTLSGEFVFDDHVLIEDNEALRSSAHVPGYFADGTWPRSAIGARDTALYRPLVLLTFFAVYQIAGPLPFAFHALNVALHAANSLIVLLLLRRLGMRGEAPALVGALLFAVHPVHVESVAWISGITDVLMTLFVLLAVWLHTHPSRIAYVGALACAACGLLSKETAVVVPVLALAHDGILHRRVRWARIGGYAGLVVLYLAVRRAALGAVLNAPHVSVAAMRRALDYALGYVTLSLVPTDIGFYLTPPDRVVALGGAVIAVALIAGAIAWAMRDRVVAFSLLWFAAAIAPALSLVFNVGSTYAQRFLYLPSVAAGLLVVRAPIFQRGRWPSVMLVTVAVGLLGALTVAGARDWHDDGVVLARAIRNTPEFPGGYWSLGRYYERTGRREDAARAYLEAARLAAPPQRAFVYHSLGQMYLAAGDLTRSLDFHARELDLDPRSTTAYMAIGNVHARRGNFAEAARAFETAWTIDRASWEALYNLALALTFLGRHEDADAHFAAFALGAPPDRYAAALADVRRRLARRASRPGEAETNRAIY